VVHVDNAAMQVLFSAAYLSNVYVCVSVCPSLCSETEKQLIKPGSG